MSALRVGDEVTILCQICASPINPTGNFHGRACSRECMAELRWREALTISDGAIGSYRGFARYKLPKGDRRGPTYTLVVIDEKAFGP